MNCTNCGKEIEQDASFCKYCGVKVGNHILDKVPSLEIEEVKDISTQVSNDTNTKSKSAIAKTIGVILFAALVLVLLLISLKSPSDKYITLIDKGDVVGANIFYKESIMGNESKEKAVIDAVEKTIEAIEEDFISGKVNFDNSMVKLTKFAGVDNSYIQYNTTKKAIEDLNISMISFKKGEDLENANDLSGAINAYSLVIPEDHEYSTAQDKIGSLRAGYIEIIKKELEKLESSQDYSKALSTVNDALRIIKDDVTLVAKKEIYNNKLDEIKRKEEQAKTEKIKLYSGKTVNSNGLSVTYKSAKLTTEIIPDDSSGSYLYYSSDNHEIYFDLVFTVKNTSSNSLKIANVFKDITVKYNNSYTYSTYSTFYSTGDDISITYDWDSIDPLISVTYHLAIKLPREVTNNSNPISISFKTLNEEQFLQFR